VSLLTVTPTGEFKHIYTNEKPLVIDVRSAREFGAFHLDGAVNIPASELSSSLFKAMLEAAKLKDKTVYILCHSGKRATAAAQRLSDEFGGHYSVVQGGTVACDDFGISIIFGSKKSLLEMPTSILGGGLILLGIALGVLVHAGFYGLAAFLGGGLIVRSLAGAGARG